MKKVVIAALILTHASGCVFRERDDKLIVIQSLAPQGTEEAARQVVQFFSLQPSEDSRGYSETETASLIVNNPQVRKAFFKEGALDPGAMAEMLMGLDRNGDRLLSPEELLRGMVETGPLIAAMQGSEGPFASLSESQVRAVVELYFDGVPVALQERLTQVLMRYDRKALGGNGDGVIEADEAQISGLILRFSKRVTKEGLERGLDLVTQLKPSERKFLVHLLDYKLRQEALGSGLASVWSSDGDVAEGPKDEIRSILVALSLLRLDQLDRLIYNPKTLERELVDPDKETLDGLLGQFYETKSPLTDREWEDLTRLYDIKALNDDLSEHRESDRKIHLSLLELFVMFTDVETADRFYSGSHALSDKSNVGLAYLFPHASIDPCPKFRSIKAVVEHLVGRQLVDHFFRTYDTDKNGTLSENEFAIGIESWGAKMEEVKSVFFRSSDRGKEITPSMFLDRGWKPLAPYLWNL